jgi:hypothetical protein
MKQYFLRWLLQWATLIESIIGILTLGFFEPWFLSWPIVDRLYDY